MKRTLLSLVALVAGFGAIILITLQVIVNQAGEDPPPAQSDLEVRPLASQMGESVRLKEWRRVAAVSYAFKEMEIDYFHDFRRNLSEVNFKAEELVVRYREDGSYYQARLAGELLSGSAARDAFESARRQAQEARFWLNPLDQLLTSDYTPKIVGSRALLFEKKVSGDEKESVLIISNREGRPEAMKLWRETLPIRGMKYDFSHWREFPGDTRLNLVYKSFIKEVELSGVKIYLQYPASPDSDRFSGLFAADSN